MMLGPDVATIVSEVGHVEGDTFVVIIHTGARRTMGRACGTPTGRSPASP